MTFSRRILYNISRSSILLFPWKKTRKGLEAADDGDVELSLDAMRVDATRELMNRKTAMA